MANDTFHNVRFPEDISYESTGGPMFRTTVFSGYTGFEQRNVEWSQPLMQFDVSYGVKRDQQMSNLIDFFNARKGRLHGFRYKNWLDYRVISEPVATGDGVNKQLPIWKFYDFGSTTATYKRLHKIVRGSVSGVGIGSAGTLVEGTDYRIDYDAGFIDFFSEIIGFGVPIFVDYLEFDEPVKFGFDSIQPAIDGYNNNNLPSLPLLGIKFPDNATFDASKLDDPYFKNVSFLCDFSEGAFLDKSNNSETISVFGDAITTSTTYLTHGFSSSFGFTGRAEVGGTVLSDLAPPVTIELIFSQPTAGQPTQVLCGRWGAGAGDKSWCLTYERNSYSINFLLSPDGVNYSKILTYPMSANISGDFSYISIDKLPSGWYILRLDGTVVAYNRPDFVPAISPSSLSFGGLVSYDTDFGGFRGNIDFLRFTEKRNRNTNLEHIEIPYIG